MGPTISELTLAVITAALFAIIYSLRVLTILERRIMSMELNIQRMSLKILKEEDMILGKLSKKSTRKTTKKSTRKTKKK
jgi:hypothetical protein